MVRLPLPLAAVAAFLFPLLALALPPALPPPSPGAPDPIADRFAAATAALSRDRRGPEGIADLAALGALEDDLSDLGRLAAAYERAADNPGSIPRSAPWPGSSWPAWSAAAETCSVPRLTSAGSASSPGGR